MQRSFRLSQRTVELLDEAAAVGGESRNDLAERLLGEAVRLQRHPLVRFHHGAAGRRQALVVGTRLYVHQVMSTLRACDNNIDTASEYLGVAPRQVRAALDYHAEFADDVDQDAAVAQRVATSYLNLDPQRRISLGKLVPKSVTGFLVEVDPQGVVTLRPATPIADVELSSAVLAEIRKGEVDALAGGGFRYRPEDGHLLEALVRDAAQADHT